MIPLDQAVVDPPTGATPAGGTAALSAVAFSDALAEEPATSGLTPSAIDTATTGTDRDRGPDLGPGLDGGLDLDLDEDRDPVRERGRDGGAGTGIGVGPLFSGTREIRTGRRADLRRQLNEVRRLRSATVILLVIAVLAAPLAFYALREAARDPVFGDLAALEVPDWAARDIRDEADGSRWCIGQCRLRQRIMRSERPPAETAAVYTTALRKAGWITWPVEGCHTDGPDGIESCWQRDEYVLDLWVYQPECEVQLKAPDDGAAGPATAEAVCPPTVVTIKVINKVGYQDKTGTGN
jgi:hypothetical protein